jgi:hypothetical protein
MKQLGNATKMKVIKSDSSGILAYQKIFKHIQANNSSVVVWQVYVSGERHILNSRLNSFHLDSGLLHFELPDGTTFNRELRIFCYSEDGQFIFQTYIKDMRSNVFSLSFPNEIKLLEETEVETIRTRSGIDMASVWKSKRLNFDHQDEQLKPKSMAERSSRDQEFLNNEFDALSLDEEEKLFAGKRESPRARPKNDKWVKLIGEESEEVRVFKLFDLSRGGIGFVCTEPNLFPKRTKVRVVGFDEFNLDDPLIAEVMSHREIDSTQTEWKIGCKFDEGQS